MCSNIDQTWARSLPLEYFYQYTFCKQSLAMVKLFKRAFQHPPAGVQIVGPQGSTVQEKYDLRKLWLIYLVSVKKNSPWNCNNAHDIRSQFASLANEGSFEKRSFILWCIKWRQGTVNNWWIQVKYWNFLFWQLIKNTSLGICLLFCYEIKQKQSVGRIFLAFNKFLHKASRQVSKLVFKFISAKITKCYA